MFQQSGELYNRLQGGWPSLKYALCAMAYSCLSIKKFYPNIELVTDSYGFRLLVNELGLPYSYVSLALNDFDANPNLWALAKVYSYGLQNEAFIHVDNDIFLWGKFPRRIEQASLCCQNIEQLSLDYQEGLDILKTHFIPSPTIFKGLADESDLSNVHAVNAGILGGNNVDFIREYSQLVMDFYTKRPYEFSLVGERIGLLNIIMEQLSFGYLARQANIEVECLKHITDFDELINNIIDIYAAPIRTKYVHCLGNIKKDLAVAQQIEFHLKSQYPEYHQRILEYCEQSGSVTALDMRQFHNFEQIFHLLSSYESVESLMDNVKFRISKQCKVKQSSDCTSLISEGNAIPLSGWGKMMVYMTEFKTGNQLTEELYNDLKDYFSKAEIQDNVFSYMLHSLYRGNFIEYIE